MTRLWRTLRSGKPMRGNLLKEVPAAQMDSRFLNEHCGIGGLRWAAPVADYKEQALTIDQSFILAFISSNPYAPQGLIVINAATSVPCMLIYSRFLKVFSGLGCGDAHVPLLLDELLRLG
jgi:hypothetical protein